VGGLRAANGLFLRRTVTRAPASLRVANTTITVELVIFIIYSVVIVPVAVHMSVIEI
jgi:hypothetical protein